MPKKHRVDGISLSIVILNILIVIVLIVLIVLIYLYMTGKLEPTDVANMDQNGTVAQITTTKLTTGEALEMDTDDSSETDEPEDTDTETTDVPEETEEEPEETEPVETDYYDPDFFENDLFIGDSIYTGLVNYGFFEANNVFAQIGLNPESANNKSYDGYTAVTKAQEMQPKRIYIMLGSNGLAYMGNTYMAEQMEVLVKALREVSPESYIYVVSIPPVTKVHDSEGKETMAMINGYNKLLKEMCENNSVVFLNLCSQLEDSAGYLSADYAEADGMHFLYGAYKHMLSFFQKSIQL